MLKIAIQKSGRLSEKSIALLQKCGIKISNGDRGLISKAENFPLEILFLRDDDIPQYVEQGVAHMGIIGQNEVDEQQKNVALIRELGFAKCRLSLAIPKDANYTDITYFKDKCIATSYPRIMQTFFAQQQVDVTIEVLNGSVEIAPSIGLADGIADLVSTGSTLISNGLKEVAVVMKSQAIMIANQNISPNVQDIIDQLLFRIDAVYQAENNKYILLNAPTNAVDKVAQILPGMKSPTILPLQDKEWCSIHSVINEDEFWDKIGQLKEVGAQGILVIPIEKMIL